MYSQRNSKKKYRLSLKQTSLKQKGITGLEIRRGIQDLFARQKGDAGIITNTVIMKMNVKSRKQMREKVEKNRTKIAILMRRKRQCMMLLEP